jgi:hypothetical protein
MLPVTLEECKARGHMLSEFDPVAFVMHQPRLQQLAGAMTSGDQFDFEGLHYAQGICLLGSSINDFLAGKANVLGDRIKGAR